MRRLIFDRRRRAAWLASSSAALPELRVAATKARAAVVFPDPSIPVRTMSIVVSLRPLTNEAGTHPVPV
ncbi:MAG TPA: hypothetical protein VJP90_02580 [Paenarthrobacter sp.]|nr:hypothetical protein [Paenarthrobacter sp.]